MLPEQNKEPTIRRTGTVPRLRAQPRYPWLARIVAAQMAGGTACASTPLALINGVVYTADDNNPRAEAVVIVDGHITYVGSTAGALSHAPSGTRRFDLRGLTVLPGLTDSHAHLAGIGFRELSFNLEGTSSLGELKKRLRDRAVGAKAGDWITGRGWIE